MYENDYRKDTTIAKGLFKVVVSIDFRRVRCASAVPASVPVSQDSLNTQS